MPEVKLARKLGFWHLFAISAGAVLGSGIFIALSSFAASGPMIDLAVIIGGIFFLLWMIIGAEFSVAMPKAASLELWAKSTLGGYAGFLMGFGYAFAWATCAEAFALGILTHYFIPGIDSRLWGIILVTIFLIINLVGVEVSGNVQLALTVGLISIIWFFNLAGIVKINPAFWHTYPPITGAALGGAIIAAMYAYVGPLLVATAAEEARDIRDMPKAMISSTIFIIVMYAVAILVLTGVCPASAFKGLSSATTPMETPFVIGMEKIAGPAGVMLIAVAAWLASATDVLMGNLYGASRLFYGMAKDGYFPKVLSYVHPRTRVPIFALFLAAAFCYFVAATGWYWAFVYIATIAWDIDYVIISLAGFLLRKKHPQLLRIWKYRGYPAIPIASLCGAIAILVLCYIPQFGGSLKYLWFTIGYLVATYLWWKLYAEKRHVRFNVEEFIKAQEEAIAEAKRLKQAKG